MIMDRDAILQPLSSWWRMILSSAIWNPVWDDHGTVQQWCTGGSDHSSEPSAGEECTAGDQQPGICRWSGNYSSDVCKRKILCGDRKRESGASQTDQNQRTDRRYLLSGKRSLEVILEDTEKSIFNLLQSRSNSDYVPIKQVVLNALDKIELASRTQGNVTGIPTGFVDLDYKLSGLQPSDMILVAARPSMGKTAFVLNIAQYAAFHEDMPLQSSAWRCQKSSW